MLSVVGGVQCAAVPRTWSAQTTQFFHVGLAGLGLDGQQEVVGGLDAGIVGAGSEARQLDGFGNSHKKTPFDSAFGLVILQPELELHPAAARLGGDDVAAGRHRNAQRLFAAAQPGQVMPVVLGQHPLGQLLKKAAVCDLTLWASL